MPDYTETDITTEESEYQETSTGRIIRYIVIILAFIIIEGTLTFLVAFDIVTGIAKGIIVTIMIIVFLVGAVLLIYAIWKNFKQQEEFEPGTGKKEKYYMSTDECRLASDKIMFFEYGFAKTKDKINPHNREIFSYVGSRNTRLIPVYIRTIKNRYSPHVALIIMRADDVIMDHTTKERRPRLYNVGFNVKDMNEVRSMVDSLISDVPNREQIVNLVRSHLGDMIRQPQQQIQQPQLQQNQGGQR